MLSVFTLLSIWLRIPEPAADLSSQPADAYVAGQTYFILVDFMGYCMLVLSGCALVYLLGVLILCLYQSKLRTQTRLNVGRQGRKERPTGASYRANLSSVQAGGQLPVQSESAR